MLRKASLVLLCVHLLVVTYSQDADPGEIRDDQGFIHWVEHKSLDAAVEGNSATLLYIASGPLYNVTLRFGKFIDGLSSGYQFLKLPGTEEITAFDNPGELFMKYSPNITENILKYTIHNVSESDEGPYFAELRNNGDGQRYKTEYAYLRSVIKKPAWVTEAVTVHLSTDDGGDGELPVTGALFIAIIAIPIAVVILVILIITIVCCVRKKRNSYSKYTATPVKQQYVQVPTKITGSIKEKTRSNLQACLMEIKVSPRDFQRTENTLQGFAQKENLEIKDNFEFRNLEPFNNEKENVEIFVNNFQQDFEDILTNIQCKDIKQALSAKKDRLALEQNIFDDGWRYCTRYCLLAFGTNEKKDIVEGIYIEYDTDITEDMLDEIDLVERLNWFRYKVMSKLKEENFIVDFTPADSLDDVPRFLITANS